MPPDTELIAKFDTIRSTFHELFTNGYRDLKEVIGEKGSGVIPIKQGSYRKQIEHLQNFVGDSVLQGTNKKNILLWLSIGAARTPENPLYRLMKTHSISYAHLSLHFSLLATLEDLWHDRHSKAYQYQMDSRLLVRLGNNSQTQKELHAGVCRQLGSETGRSWAIVNATVDGKAIARGEEEQHLLKKLTREQYDALFLDATRAAQRNGSAQTQLPEGWRLLSTREIYLCYRRRGNGLERMTLQQLKEYWDSGKRDQTFHELLQTAKRRCENRRTGALHLSSFQADDVLQLSPERFLILHRASSPPLRFATLDQLRQECSHADFDTLREILLDIWTDYCHGTASAQYDGHSYTLEVCWSDTVDALITSRVFENRLPAYVENGLLLCQTGQKPYRYKPSPMRPYLYGQGLFELYPGLEDAVVFFSEICPLGVIGSQIMDHADLKDRPFVFRDRYYGQAADSLLLFDLLESIRLRQVLRLEAELVSERTDPFSLFQPMCILSDLHQGRQYLYGCNLTKNLYTAFRLDMIRSTAPAPEAEWSQERTLEGMRLLQRSWSNRVRTGEPLPLIMELHYEHASEFYFHERVYRERRNAVVSDLTDDSLQLAASVWDPREMTPWTLSLMGRITRLQSTPIFQERFRQHVEGMQERYNNSSEAGTLPFAPADKHYTPNSITPDKTHTTSPLFLDFASRYVVCYQHILQAFSRPLRIREAEAEIERIAQTYGFSRSAMPHPDPDPKKHFDGISLPPLLEKHLLRREMIKGEEYICANVNATPGRPFTFWELRWLLTILEDRRMKLFLPADNIAQARKTICDFLRSCSDALAGYDPAADTEEDGKKQAKKPTASEDSATRSMAAGVASAPLYTPETFIRQGVCHDSDPYENELYQMHFALLTNHICAETAVSVTYRPTKRSTSRTVILWPLKLEYSPMRDKLYLIARMEDGRYITIRLSTISSIDPVPFGDAPDEAGRGSWEDYLQANTTSDEEALDVIVSSESNAIERFLLEFSVYRKVAERIGNGDTFRVKVWYLKTDTSEMIIKLLRYGRTIEVLGPELVRSDIAKRVKTQYDLLSDALPHPEN